MAKFKKYQLNSSVIMDDQILNLSGFIEEDAPCRVIEQIIWELDTSAIESSYSDKGQRGYHPKMLLSVIFYGYTQGLRSGSNLETACVQDLRYIYLSRAYRPSSSTFNDFRQRHSQSFEDLFVQVVQKGMKLGLIDLSEGVFGDGTKIRANASPKRSKKQSSYEKWLGHLRADITEIEVQLTKTKASTDSNDDLKKDLSSKQALVKKIEQRLERFKEDNTPDQVNLTDPDAHFMRGKKGYKDTFYNPQIAVSVNQFILHNHISISSSDRKQLRPCMEGLKHTLGKYPEQSAWDCGYSSFDNEVFLEQCQVEAYIPDQDFGKSFQDQPFHRFHFQYDPQKDHYVCPKGKTLTFKRNKSEKGQKWRVYQGTQCEGCPFKKQCTKASARTIQRNMRQPLRDKMYHRLLTTQGRHIFAKRKHTVEPVFGHLKHNLGYQQFLLRSLEKVQAEFNIICIAYNLMKIVKYQAKNSFLTLGRSIRTMICRLNSIVNELGASFFRCFIYKLFYNVNS